jgi:hypothetical protein
LGAGFAGAFFTGLGAGFLEAGFLTGTGFPFGFPAGLEGAFLAGFAAGFLAAALDFFAGMDGQGVEFRRMFSSSPHRRAGKRGADSVSLARKRKRIFRSVTMLWKPEFWPVAAFPACRKLPAMSTDPSSSSPVTRLWSFIRAILDLVLDLSFKRLVTPKLIRVVYALSLVGAVIYTWRWMDSFLGFITAPLALLAYAIVARVTVELILVIFRIAEKIAPLDENAPQAEDVLSKLKK